MFEEEKFCAKPFLKWAGGKSNLLSDLVKIAPTAYDKYIEPFLGGGALFFGLCPDNAVISDLNSELINCYRVVRDNLDELVEKLKEMPVSKELFYFQRGLDIEELSEVQRAARFIYLNKTCYNGLYRVNMKGKFNTPFGKNTSVNICNYEVLHKASLALKGSKEIIVGDFEDVLIEHAKKEDFVYLDPPYPSVGIYSDFKRYTKQFFNEDQHHRLSKVVKTLDNKGCKFILSYASHEFVNQLYPEFRKIDVQAPRFINCRGNKRGNVSEIIVTNIE
jgi:DNA adenine methylase